MSIGKIIRQYRKERGWAGVVLADLAGIHQSYLSRVERGKVNMSLENLYRVAGALGVSPERLVAEAGNVVEAPLPVRGVPVLETSEVGSWLEGQSKSSATKFIGIDPANSPRSFALQVRGNSMEPNYKDGHIVVFDPRLEAEPGDMVVARDSQGVCYFRKFCDAGIGADGKRVFELAPLNRDYATMRSDQIDLLILGVMVEHRIFRRAI